MQILPITPSTLLLLSPPPYVLDETESTLLAQANADTPVVGYTYDEEGEVVWSQCWDDEAGAVYYFNNATGEASWLPPEET